MKLDRNAIGRNKYALIKNRRINEFLRKHGMLPGDLTDALLVLEQYGVLDWGDAPETEFFVIRLKDENAAAALCGYASEAAAHGDAEYAGEVDALADRSGPNHPNCKKPD